MSCTSGCGSVCTGTCYGACTATNASNYNYGQYVNIGGTWKFPSYTNMNIGGTWKKFGN